MKVLSCGSQLMKAINRVVTARTFQNGTEDGIMDRVKGYNIVITKTGTGLDTEYGAMGWNAPLEMDEKYYTEKAIPNVIELTEKKIKSDDHLRSVIRNYFYGEEIVADSNGVSDEEDGVEAKPQTVAPPPAKPAAKAAGTGRPSAAAAAKAEPPAGGTGRPSAAKAAPASTGRGAGKPAAAADKAAAPARNVLKDLTSLDD